ncbi:MAG: AI-2E family transporter [Thermomicrobiales bacterium]
MINHWLHHRIDGRLNAPDSDESAGKNRESSSPDEEHDDINIFPAVRSDDESAFVGEENHPVVKPVFGKSDPVPDSEKTVTRIEIPFRTIIKVLATLLGVWLILQISQILLLVFIAVLISLALVPPVRFLENRGLSRAAAAGVTFLVLLGAVVGYFGIIVPPLVEQTQTFIDDFPDYAERFEGLIARYPSVNERYLDIRENGLGENVELPWLSFVQVGSTIIGSVANILFVLVLSFYFILEGDRTYRYVARYCTPKLRYRIRMAFPELTRVVSGFVVGQIITSTMFGIFVFFTLLFTGVPQPLLLAVIAALLNVVPIVGVPAATIPAVLLAATVSWPTALTVLIAYVVYQQFENYILVPRVYGKTLQVTSLSILLGVLIGGQLLGIIGVIIALPVAAAIPVLERVWREEVPDELTVDMI